MSNKDERASELPVGVAQYIEQFRLPRGIERTSGFVSNDHIRPAGQGLGNGNPLKLPSTQLMRIRLANPVNLNQPYILENCLDLLFPVLSSPLPVRSQDLSHLVADAHNGTQ